MPGPLVPLPQTVWKLQGALADPNDDRNVVEVTSADRDVVVVRSLAGGGYQVDFKELETTRFMAMYEPVRHHGAVAKRGTRTRWERLTDEDDF